MTNTRFNTIYAIISDLAGIQFDEFDGFDEAFKIFDETRKNEGMAVDEIQRENLHFDIIIWHEKIGLAIDEIAREYGITIEYVNSVLTEYKS